MVGIKRMVIVIGSLFLALFMPFEASAADDIGIFEKILDASGDFSSTTAAFEKALSESKLVLAGKFDPYVPEKSKQKARTYILTSPTFIAAAASEPGKTSTAQILRVSVYTYGAGNKTFINMANPVPEAMIFYNKSSHYAELVAAAKNAAEEIRAVAAKVPGKPMSVQVEPSRTEKTYNSFNGDSMGKMMALFQNWQEAQHDIFEDGKLPPEFGNDLNSAVGAVRKMVSASTAKDIEDSKGWNSLAEIPVGSNAVVFVVTNGYMQNKCITIDSLTRSDGKTDDAPYPGIDHSPAVALEILVFKDGDKVRVVQYNLMWYFQKFYWDAGYAAFGLNAAIPPILERSLEGLLGYK